MDHSGHIYSQYNSHVTTVASASDVAAAGAADDVFVLLHGVFIVYSPLPLSVVPVYNNHDYQTSSQAANVMGVRTTVSSNFNSP